MSEQLEFSLWRQTNDGGLKVLENRPEDPNREPNRHDVAMLENILRSARRGQTEGVALIAFMTDCGVTSAFTSGIKNDCFRGIGAVEYLKGRILDYAKDLR